MRNSLVDLNEYLFTALDRISNDDLTDEKLDQEIKRTEAIVKTGDMIVRTGELVVKAEKLVLDTGFAPNTERFLGASDD